MSDSVQEIKDIPMPKRDLGFYYDKDCKFIVNSDDLNKLSKLPQYRLVFMFDEGGHRYNYKVEKFKKKLFCSDVNKKKGYYPYILNESLNRDKDSTKKTFTKIGKELGITCSHACFLFKTICGFLTFQEYWEQIYISQYVYKQCNKEKQDVFYHRS